MTTFDNVLAYQEGQAGESLQIEPDLFAFMGGISTGLRLIVRLEITSYAQLRASTLAVDSLSTGYTLLLYKLLDQHGIAPGPIRWRAWVAPHRGCGRWRPEKWPERW